MIFWFLPLSFGAHIYIFVHFISQWLLSACFHLSSATFLFFIMCIIDSVDPDQLLIVPLFLFLCHPSTLWNSNAKCKYSRTKSNMIAPTIYWTNIRPPDLHRNPDLAFRTVWQPNVFSVWSLLGGFVFLERRERGFITVFRFWTHYIGLRWLLLRANDYSNYVTHPFTRFSRPITCLPWRSSPSIIAQILNGRFPLIPRHPHWLCRGSRYLPALKIFSN